MCAEWRTVIFTGLLRHFIPRNDSRFFVHVSPADFVLAASCASLGFIASVARQSSGLVLRVMHIYSHHFFTLCTFLLRENFICVRVFYDKAKWSCRGVRTSNLQCPRGQKIPPIYDLGWREAIYSNKPAIFCKL